MKGGDDVSERDLREDLKYIDDLCPVNTFIAREAIERALKAEAELKAIKDEPLKVDWPENIENELEQYDWLVRRQTAKIRDLKAKLAKMQKIIDGADDLYWMRQALAELEGEK